MKSHRTAVILLSLFFLTLSLGQLEKVTLYASVAIYLHEVIMGIWLMYWVFKKPLLISMFLHKIMTLPLSIRLFCIWLVVGWLSALFNQGSLIEPLLFVSRIAFYFAFFFSITVVVSEKIISTAWIKKGMFASGMYILYFGFLQYIFLPDTRFLLYQGWDDHYFRLISTILDPGFTGILFILNLFLLFQLWIHHEIKNKDRTSRFSQALLALSTFLLTLGMSLTYSRATYLAFAISGGLTVILFFVQRKKVFTFLILGSLVFLLVSLPLLPRPDGEGVKLERVSTIYARSSSAQSELKLLNPWQWVIGKGMFVTASNQFLDTTQQNHNRVPDNWLVMFITGSGLIGTSLFLWSVAQIALKQWRTNSLFWLGFIAVLIHGLFNASLVYPFVLAWLGTLALTHTPYKEN